MNKAILQVLSIVSFESDNTSTALNKEISRVKKNICDKIKSASVLLPLYFCFYFVEFKKFNCS